LISNKNKIRRLRDHTKGCFKIFFIFRPISIILGVIFFLLSFGISLSVTLTLLNRILNFLNCGQICGFILKFQELVNPLDHLLVLVSNYFPFDYLIITVLIIYIYLCTLSAITRIGIRICCYKLFPIRKKRTPPQALLIACIMLMLSVLSLNNLLTNAAPTYSMFGSQMVIPNNSSTETPVHCSITHYNSTTNNCVMTKVGEMINIISLTVPFMGIIFFGMLVLFVLTWLICIFVAGFSKKVSLIDQHSSDDEIPENFQ